MKLRKIDITNFQGIEHTQICPAHKVTVIMDRIGRGKSSILRAIIYGLTGNAPENMIRDGSNYASVAITLGEGDNILREKTEKGQTVFFNGSRVTNKNLVETLERYSGVSKDAMRIITSKDVFESLKPDEFGSFLLQYIPEAMDLKQLESFFSEGLTTQQKKVLEMYLPPSPNKFGIEEVQKAFDQIDEQRKYHKRNVAFLTKKKEEIPVDGRVARPLAEIEKDIEAALIKKGEFNGVKKNWETYYSAAKTMERQKAGIKKAEDELAAYQSVTKPSEKKKADLEKREQEIRESQQNTAAAILHFNFELKKENANLTALRAKSCPLCETVECPVDKSVLLENAADRIQSLKDGLFLQQKKKEQLDAEAKAVKAEQDAYRKNELAYMKKLEVVKNLDRMKAASCAANLPPIPQVSREEIEKTEKMIQDLYKEKEISKRRQEYDQISRQLEAEESNHAVYDFLASELRPKGHVTNKILAYYCSIFDNACEPLSMEVGFEIHFVAENGICMMVKPGKDKALVPYKSLSTGEKILASFIMLDMLNKLTGFNILLLDDVEHLDHDTFEAFFKTLVENPDVQSRYDHIFVACAEHKDLADYIMKYRKQIDVVKIS